MNTVFLTLAALLCEAAFGYPDAAFHVVRHPVMWMGALIDRLDRVLNRPPASRAVGVLGLGVLLLVTAAGAVLVSAGLRRVFPPWPAFAVEAAVASSLLASRSLHAHVEAVANGLRQGLPQARAAVARIVGRDPLSLDAAGIARAAIESLAENFADGVTAPALWCALLGLPGIALYKAVNTADSMVGHRTPRHERFGWAAARLDDLVNLPASRFAALWLVLAAAIMPGADARGALRAVLRDARHHRSPNAGWPEAAMAGALGLRLAGPRSYAGVVVEDGWMGDGRAEATAEDVARALHLYRVACLLQIAAVAGVALALAGQG